jgi:hypothetical protein
LTLLVFVCVINAAPAINTVPLEWHFYSVADDGLYMNISLGTPGQNIRVSLSAFNTEYELRVSTIVSSFLISKLVSSGKLDRPF